MLRAYEMWRRFVWYAYMGTKCRMTHRLYILNDGCLILYELRSNRDLINMFYPRILRNFILTFSKLASHI